VSEATRRRVLQAADELSRLSPAVPPVVAQPPAILLVHPATLRSSQVFRELLLGLQTGIDEAQGRLSMTVYQVPLRANHATHVLLHDRALRPDGVVLMGARLNDPILEEVRRARAPCVLLGRQQGPDDVMTVGVDNVTGAREATRHLIELGHRRVAFLGGSPEYDYTTLRHQGYADALRAAGLPADGLTFLGEAEQATRAFLQADTGATAIVFVNDEHALKAIPLLRHRGLTIPRDISVVGFDDTDEAINHTPPLTSVAVPRAKIGYWTARLLIERIRDPDLSFRILLRPRLSVRASGARREAGGHV
jgi:LacI family transcriptional regulator